MPPTREIRAEYDADTILVYQAYAERIARPALQAQRFVDPFSFTRMTWIKPSFLWMMERCGWGTKPDQECILGIRVRRERWDAALREGELTTFTERVHDDRDAWRRHIEEAPIRVQWDPERSIRGSRLEHRSIQVGIGRTRIRDYASRWIVSIEDLTPAARKIRRLVEDGHCEAAQCLLPEEKPYPVDEETARRLGM